ncbi:MAG: gas vesicle protein K [Actinobacteria bacterium]|nr:gas vesicle protein K [Actinomycetota bacterium]MBU4403776.1 gas vesicle protein K [Actinomycetota bacterium]MCG2819297.1 gas vesicle protein K [Actinomycetes bacterium]
MVVDIDEKNLKHGLLGLVIAIVEVVTDTLKAQATHRMDGGSLSEEEIERLGEALMELDNAIGEIKREQGVSEAVQSVREQLDELADTVINDLLGADILGEARRASGGEASAGGTA